MAATGDDKANLVVSLLAKTEFGVPRTVARVNNPKNEWMFDEAWGVDVAVSTPRLMTALVEEAVVVGDLVRIFEFQQGHADDGRADASRRTRTPATRVGDVAFPADTVLVGIIRDERPIAPSRDDALEAARRAALHHRAEVEAELESMLSPGDPPERQLDDCRAPVRAVDVASGRRPAGGSSAAGGCRARAASP